MSEGEIEKIKLIETEEQKRERFAAGQISNEEIKQCWANPDEFIFEQELTQGQVGEAEKAKFRIWPLNEGMQEALLSRIKESWDPQDFRELEETLKKFFAQKKSHRPGLLNIEYYAATDIDDKPFAITGIYTNDIDGGAGFATRDKLDLGKHFLTARLGWFSVGKEYQGTGVGGFLFDWVEKMAKARGATTMAIETDDYENEKTALALYESRGYKPGFNIKDYFGPNRDLFVCSSRVTTTEKSQAPSEKITVANKEEILSLGEKIYSPERFEEFRACLDLFLNQEEETKTILVPQGVVLRDTEGRVSGFSILTSGIYENALFSNWEGVSSYNAGSKRLLVDAMRSCAVNAGKGVLVLSREGEDQGLLQYGFEPAQEGIPEVFGKGDPTKFLLYSKKL